MNLRDIGVEPVVTSEELFGFSDSAMPWKAKRDPKESST